MEIFGHSPVGLGEFGGDMPGYVKWPGNSVFAAAYPEIDIEVSNEIKVEAVNITTVERGQETSRTNIYTTETIDGSSLTVGTEETHTFGNDGWQQAHNSEFDTDLAKDYTFQIGEGNQKYVQGHTLGVSLITEESEIDGYDFDSNNPVDGKITKTDLSTLSREYVGCVFSDNVALS